MPPFLSPVEHGQLDTVRVAVYVRQSSARADSSEASPETQIAACTGAVMSRARDGWRTTAVYKDIGCSGWAPGEKRPGFDALMAAVDRGEVDVVIVNELSRLTRKGAQDAMVIDERLKEHGVRLISVKEPFLDTSNPIGQAVFALIASLAKQESDIKGERLRAVKETISQLGGRHSGVAPYGMRAVREKSGNIVLTVLEPDADNPNHVEVVERMVEYALNGMPLNRIATTLEKEGIPSPGESERRNTPRRAEAVRRRRVTEEDTRIVWRAQTVRWILRHPAIGGFASRHVNKEDGSSTGTNVIAYDKAGEPLTPHRGIISGEKWLALQESLNQRSRTPRKSGHAVTEQLLSGWRFLRCGICQGAMGQNGPTNQRSLSGSYSCAGPKGHGGLAIAIWQADDFVARRVWARLRSAKTDCPDDRDWLTAAARKFAERSDLAGVEDERRETTERLTLVRESIRGLHEDRKQGIYRGSEELAVWRETVIQYRKFEEDCVAHLEDLERRTTAGAEIPREWLRARHSDPLGPGSVWESWDVHERREFLSLFLVGVQVGRGRDPETRRIIPTERRVHLEWRRLPDSLRKTQAGEHRQPAPC